MNDLDELQRLLLGKDKEVLDELDAHLHDPVLRARFVAQVLPQAVQDAARGGDHLVRALQKPVTHCIRHSVQRDARIFAEALYPAMGPAIRKSISETLRQFVQSINQALEHSVSVKGLRWRWQAWRSGVSFAEIVLKNTLLYRVEEVYLIHRESGLLVEHAAAADVAAVKDQDAVSAMLTAIQDFVRDAFSGGSERDLETLEMGEHTLWVIRGPQAMMACAIRGIPPGELRDRLHELLNEIHMGYADSLSGFDGDREGMAGVSEVLHLALESQAREPAQAHKRPWPSMILLLLMIAAGVWAWQYYSRDPLDSARGVYLAALEQEPGLVQIHTELKERRLYLRGLRDPLARDPLQLAAESGLPATSLELDYRPYQSLEPDLILTRTRNRLLAPTGVRISLEGDVLYLKGKADIGWISGVKQGFATPAGVGAVDLSGLHEDREALLRQLHEALKPPPDVRLRLDGYVVGILGNAPWAWLQGIAEALKPLTWLDACDISTLEIAEWSQLVSGLAALGSVEVIFTEGVVMAPDSSQVLDSALRALLELKRLAEVMDMALRIQIVGHSDGIGNKALNYWLRYQRGQYVKQSLVQAGIPVGWIRTDVHPEFVPATQIDPARRKVVLSVSPPDRPEPELRKCR